MKSSKNQAELIIITPTEGLFGLGPFGTFLQLELGLGSEIWPILRHFFFFLLFSFYFSFVRSFLRLFHEVLPFLLRSPECIRCVVIREGECSVY